MSMHDHTVLQDHGQTSIDHGTASAISFIIINDNLLFFFLISTAKRKLNKLL